MIPLWKSPIKLPVGATRGAKHRTGWLAPRSCSLWTAFIGATRGAKHRTGWSYPLDVCRNSSNIIQCRIPRQNAQVMRIKTHICSK